MHLLLQIKINNRWNNVVLNENTDITIEKSSPLFDAEAPGSFSYPFTLPMRENAHIFPTLESMHGRSIYSMVDKKPFRLYMDGVILAEGVVKLNDEVDMDMDEKEMNVEIYLVSGNKDLMDEVESMKAQEVTVKDKIPVGTEFRKIEATTRLADLTVHMETALPPDVFTLNRYTENLDGTGKWVNPTNVSKPYPFPYCNVMVATQAREMVNGQYQKIREYEVFDADRPNSGVCFYVMYFLDCLFAMLGIAYDSSELMKVEDLKRLAFFTTKCHCDAVPTAQEYKSETKRFESLMAEFDELTIEWGRMHDVNRMSATAWRKYANGKNFPDVDVKQILQDVQNAFGIRFIYDSSTRECKAVLTKEVMKNKKVFRSGAVVTAEEKKETRIKGVKMSYGENEGTEYNYDPKNTASPVVEKKSYEDIVNKKGANDRNTYYCQKTGNMYRIKVDDDAKTEKELFPSLMEVGAFADAWIGDVTEEEATKRIDIGFKPVINNIIGYIQKDKAIVTTGLTSAITSSGRTTTEAASKCPVFLDVEMNEPEIYNIKETKNKEKQIDYGWGLDFWIKYKARFGFSQEYATATRNYDYEKDVTWGKGELPTAPLATYNESPINAYDAGYCIGIMQGAGSGGNADITEENYDGNGNAKWAFTPKGYAFTADSIDHYGQMYDYDAQTGEGTNPEGRISLKLRAEKVRTRIDEKVENGQVVVDTMEKAAYWLQVLFGDGNVSPLELKVKKTSELASAGHDISAFGVYAAVAPVIIDGKLMNCITPDGVWDKRNMTLYIQTYTKSDGKLDDILGLCVMENARQQDVDNLIKLTNTYYMNDVFPRCTIEGVPSPEETTLYPISQECAGRGLLDKMNIDFFYFITHARLTTLSLTAEIAEVAAWDVMQWLHIGNYTGLIKSISYTASNQKGLTDLKMELLYLAN